MQFSLRRSNTKMNSMSYSEWTALTLIRISSLVLLFTLTGACLAAIYKIAGDEATVIGEVSYMISKHEDTLPDIARKHNLGFDEIKLANPSVDLWIPGDNREIVLPKKFVLPVAEHDGIVLNIPEMRLYYFPDRRISSARKVITHPLGVGKEGWATPYIDTRIIQKRKNPDWYPPESIRADYAAKGRSLPKRVVSGPENPLGAFAMRLGLPAYLIHGTNKPSGVGMRVSYGCIRLFPEDIESLYEQVQLGTPVHIINQPYKIGVVNDQIYLEAHPFLAEDIELFDGNLTSVVKMIIQLTDQRKYDVDWDLANQVISRHDGLPVKIGKVMPVIDEVTVVADGKLDRNSQPKNAHALK